MYILKDVEDFLCREITDCAFKVHKELGPGLLERMYEVCFCHELSKKDIPFQRQVKLPIHYDGIVFNEGLQLDVLVDNRIICELKAVDTVNPIWQAQLISHLKLCGLNVGFTINFNTVLLKDGIRRLSVN